MRTALVGGALAILTVAGHLAGGGGIDPVGTSLVTVLALGLGWAVSAGALPPVRLLAVLVAGQAFLHLVLTFSAGHAHGTASASTTTMIAGHVVAAVVAAVLVRTADQLIDRWSALLAALLGTPWSPALPVTRSQGSTVPVSVRADIGLLHLEHRVHRRGPPTAAVLLTA